MRTRRLDSRLAGNDLVLRSSPNWTAVGFFVVLGLVHVGIAVPAFALGGIGGHLSLAFGSLFLAAALVSYCCCYEVAVRKEDKLVSLRRGVGRLAVRQQVPFEKVYGVRLTMAKATDSRIELLCDDGNLECPTTSVPRQQALCLAMLMNVEFIKVCDDEDRPSRLERRLNELSEGA